MAEVKYGIFKFNRHYAGEQTILYASCGTTFLINDGHIDTAAHCVYDSEYLLEWTGNKGKAEEDYKDRLSYSVTVECDMTVSASSELRDFVILKLDQRISTRKYLTMRDSKEVKQAEVMYSVGFPAFYGRQAYNTTYTVDEVTVKTDIVTKTQSFDDFVCSDDDRQFKGDMLNTSCVISGGDFGGPWWMQTAMLLVLPSVPEAMARIPLYRASAIDQVFVLAITWVLNTIRLVTILPIPPKSWILLFLLMRPLPLLRLSRRLRKKRLAWIRILS